MQFVHGFLVINIHIRLINICLKFVVNDFRNKKIKSCLFWDITLCGPLKVYRRFAATYRLQLRG
jgi:hypothetical protein